MSNDVEVVQQTDMFTQQDINRIRQEIVDGVRKQQENAMELGRRLWLVKNGGWWQEWEFNSFDEYVELELGFKKRKGQYLAGVWRVFGVELGIPEDTIREIGFTKAGHLYTIVNADNVDYWLEQAKKHNVPKLIDIIRRAREISESSHGGSLPVKDPAAKKKAKSSSEDTEGDETDSDFDPENETDAPASVGPSLVDDTDEKLYRTLQVALYKEQSDNIDRAMNVAQSITGSNVRGHNLDTICTMFLAMQPTSDLSKASTLSWLTGRIEEDFDVKILTFKKSKDLLVQLEEFLEQFRGIHDGKNSE